MTVLPADQVAAAPVGLAMPVGYTVTMLRGEESASPVVLSRIGRLPFGWSGFEAVLYDHSGGLAVVLTDDNGRQLGRLELGERETGLPQLVGHSSRELLAADRSQVFIGEAPVLRVRATRETFESQWMITVEPVIEYCDGAPKRLTPAAANLFVEPAVGDAEAWVEVPLEQPSL